MSTRKRAVPSPIGFGIWLPIYGKWLRTRESSVAPDIRSCIEVGRLADGLGYDFLYASEDVLNSVHGPCAPVLDAWSLLSSLAAVTRRIGLCGAIKPGLRSPLLAARMIETVSLIAGRRVTVNITSGWWKDEFDAANVALLDHKGRYDRADTFLRTLSRFRDPGMAHDASLEIGSGGAPTNYRMLGFDADKAPDIWVSGHSERATALAAEWAGCLFLNGLPDVQLTRHIVDARQAALRWDRRVAIAVNAFVIAAESAATAAERREQIVETRNDEAIAFFRAAMQASGATTWTDLTDELMIDTNSGFNAHLIGSFAEVRNRVEQLSALGVDKIVCQFEDPLRDIGPFMQQVVQPLREGRAL
ncbi:FMNH2-dependent dimethyl sulfone monooxygenase [Paraburkholderia atlantica]|uniref:FMNH2-dependent dimethyl sulfone monooxygenase n=2 Tax=Paraburkholderia atlantica TaxID=2654982 RepID=A0A7W8Q675_PARAM|nr:LLM class flavin-dependent oxidoreductase [Paraburkholderia atlantica]MBB5415262.1 FMNH2-dependent dimethyl sulfone monooxygenase [Paraburkholderia atlantica]MBB5424065.1 FMNH2-dependent dimethyl sulfone monooxygenase [Paraburkholderia atlantica]